MTQPHWRVLLLEAVRWRKADQPGRAIECLSQSIEITRQAPELAQETGSALNYLADVFLQQGQLSSAEVAIRQAIQCRLGLPAPEQSLAGDDFVILAKVLHAQGRRQEAVEAGGRGVTLLERAYGTQDQVVGQTRRLLEGLRQSRVTA